MILNQSWNKLHFINSILIIYLIKFHLIIHTTMDGREEKYTFTIGRMYTVNTY